MNTDRTHDRTHFPESLRRSSAYRRMRGGALVELVVIGVPIIMFLTLGMVQLILIGHARATLNYAALLAARQGAVHHARITPMQNGLAAGLAPMFGAQAATDLQRTGGADGVEPVTYALPEGKGYRTFTAPQGERWRHPANPIRSEARSVASQAPAKGSEAASHVTEKAVELATQDLKDYARITILNPTTEAFEDFARPLRLYDGHKGIPNAGLYRMSGASTHTISARVCKPVATPTVNDLEAPLRIKVPSKDELKSALLDGVATADWGGAGFGSDITQDSAIVTFRKQISDMIDQADLDSPASAIELYDAVNAKAHAFVEKHGGKLPEWQIGQVRSVMASADILARATAGSARPSEADIRAAIGPTGMSGGHYLDMGGNGLQDDWDTWTCGTGDHNQASRGCVHDNASPDTLWGSVAQAFKYPPDKINYTKLANKIAKLTGKFKAHYGSKGNGELTLEQNSFAQHVDSLFGILGKSRDLGAYRNQQLCSIKTFTASTRPEAGAASDVNIQDANLLKIHVLYGYKLIVPFVGEMIVDLMDIAGYEPAGGLAHKLVQDIYDNGRIPLTATAIVRMQTPAYENEDMLSRTSSFFVDE